MHLVSHKPSTYLGSHDSGLERTISIQVCKLCFHLLDPPPTFVNLPVQLLHHVHHTNMTTFHPFGLLPAELRNAIWELTLDSREVTIKANRHACTPDDNLDVSVYFTSPTLIPSALQACPDSRSLLASRHYTRAFSNGTTPHHVWVAFALDTIRICDVDLPYLVRLSNPLPIRHLTIDCPAHSVHDRWDPKFTEYSMVLLKLGTLERASVVCALEYHASRSIHPTCADKWDNFLSFFQMPSLQKPENSPPHWTMRFADTGDRTARELFLANAHAWLAQSAQRTRYGHTSMSTHQLGKSREDEHLTACSPPE